MQNLAPAYDEKLLSQIPALKQLINLGYIYLSPKEALAERYNKNSNILLERILAEQLKKINRINYRGEEYLFSEENIQAAIQKLKNPQYDGLLKTSEDVYDLLTLGCSLAQSVEGDLKSHSFKYIDFKDIENNVFHVTAEFSVERNHSTEPRRPDIVVFVNGIPLIVMECKKPSIDLAEAVTQLLLYQRDENIPKLFIYSQILIAINSREAKYATTGAASEYWGIWRELESKDEEMQRSVSKKLSSAQKDELFQGDFSKARRYFNIQDQAGKRLLTEQDKLIFSLCRRDRLLDLVFNYMIYDSGNKKIARYQQYFVIRSTMARISAPLNGTFAEIGVRQQYPNLERNGGIIWHTQGSGKSLTMVMLVRAITMSKDISNPRILLVTDREDLDKQLTNTFKACGLSMKKASSGRNLIAHLKNQESIITTLIHKFDKALNAESFQDESGNIFVLVDESHRTNFGNLHASMRKMLPNACYLGFTGTPLLKAEKNNFSKFGGLIEPHYSIRQAVEDKAVVPLLYEARLVDISQNEAAIDLWFERHTVDLSKDQKTSLKKKYSSPKMLQKTDQVIYMVAFDINEHFMKNWQGTGFKAQLVTPNKKTAIKYYNYLRDLGSIKSAVIISPPQDLEGTDDEGDVSEVNHFWQQMMEKYGSEKNYTDSIINEFKKGDELEIIIVVDKLLTGFDAPKNTVLYLCRTLKEHTLLQAIARVNRLAEAKEFGYIVDYANVVSELDKAFNIYDALEGYDKTDLEGAFANIDMEISRLAQVNSNLWNIFKEVQNKTDDEALQQELAKDSLREEFYDALNEYSKVLKIALSSEKFIRNESQPKINRYKHDLRYFYNLKEAVKQRYADTVDFKKYDKKIEKLMNTYIYANEIVPLNQPVNIFSEESFNQLKSGKGHYANLSVAAKADELASVMKKEIVEKLALEDPVYYQSLSERIQKTIEEFRNKQISDVEYLQEMIDVRNNKITHKKREDIPAEISNNDEAAAYYSAIKPFYIRYLEDDVNAEIEVRVNCQNEPSEASKTVKLNELTVLTALKFIQILDLEQKVDFWNDENAVKKVMNLMDDFFYDEIKAIHRLQLSTDDMDEIIDKVMQIAKYRRS